MIEVKEYLKKNRLLCDGALGTYYASLGNDGLSEKANIINPLQVEQIHLKYIESGANLIRTNTFSANTQSLQCAWEETTEYIRAGFRIAREAVKVSGKEIYIAADIGPMETTDHVQNSQNSKEYLKIAEVFLEEGADIILFETFSDTEGLREVFKEIKEKNPSVFIMAQFALNQHGYTEHGLGIHRILEWASNTESLDLIGFNCGVGPGHLLRLLSQTTLPKDIYISALPNAGYPDKTAGRVEFLGNKEYFAQKLKEIGELGVHVLGGCCGTDPDYIAAVSRVMNKLEQSVFRNTTDSIRKDDIVIVENNFINIQSDKMIAIELSPPLNADSGNIMDAANILRQCNVDIVNFPDSPSGRTRADSVLMAVKVLHETGLNVMPHVCCRDKNAIAIRSQILGAYMNGVKKFLVVTGDPVPIHARGDIKSVFNFDSIGMMKIMQQMNEEQFIKEPLIYGGAINQTRRNIEVEINRVKRKIEAGATFFMTQPAFSDQDLERIRYIKKETGAFVLCGIMPLVSRKNAVFMKNEMTGIEVPEEVVNRYEINMTKEEGENIGILLAQEIMEKSKEFADGYYFSIPFNRTYLLKQILQK